MEAGFAGGPLSSCLGNETVSGGIDTNLAEHMLLAICPEQADTISVLDSCGGHAVPYHYHERMTCLYTPDPVAGHSTRIGAAGDGNGIYGKPGPFRELYPELCLNATIEVVTTLDGAGEYALDCPCFDEMQSNVIGQGRPGYLPAAVVVEEDSEDVGAEDSEDAEEEDSEDAEEEEVFSSSSSEKGAKAAKMTKKTAANLRANKLKKNSKA